MSKTIGKDSVMYKAILEAMFKIFDTDIEMTEPWETTDEFVKAINEYLKGK